MTNEKKLTALIRVLLEKGIITHEELDEMECRMEQEQYRRTWNCKKVNGDE